MIFDEYQNSSSDTSDEPSSPQPVKLDLRVPSAPSLDKFRIKELLSPQKQIIQYAISALMFRNPVLYLFVALSIEGMFLIAYFLNLGFLECSVFAILLSLSGKLLYTKYSDFVDKFILQIHSDTEEDNNIDEEFEKFTYLLSVVGSRIHCFYLSCRDKREDRSFVGVVIWLWFHSCIFFLTKIFSTFSVVFVSTQFVLFLTPIYFYPCVHPYLNKQLDKLMELVAPKKVN